MVRILFRSVVFVRVSDAHGLLPPVPERRLLLRHRRSLHVHAHQVRTWNRWFHSLLHYAAFTETMETFIFWDIVLTPINYLDFKAMRKLRKNIISNSGWWLKHLSALNNLSFHVYKAKKMTNLDEFLNAWTTIGRTILFT